MPASRSRPKRWSGCFNHSYRVAEQGSQQGLGLGLYIASEIARAHGGRIDVISSPAETRLTFRMPLQ